MGKRANKNKKPTTKQSKQRSSPLTNKDIQVEVIVSSKKGVQKGQEKKKRAKNKQSKLQKFQSLMVPQNNVDQIRLQHISSKIQQNYRSQNQSYLLKIKSTYDQYKQLIMKYTLLTELETFQCPINLLRNQILKLFVSQIIRDLTYKQKDQNEIFSIDNKIFNLLKHLQDKNQENLHLKQIISGKWIDQTYLRLKILMKQKQTLNSILSKQQLVQKLQESIEFNGNIQNIDEISHFQLINYFEILESQEKNDIIDKIIQRPQVKISISEGFFKKKYELPQQQINLIRQFILKQAVKQQFDFNKVSQKSQLQSKESIFSKADSYVTPCQNFNFQFQPQQKQQKQFFNQKDEQIKNQKVEIQQIKQFNKYSRDDIVFDQEQSSYTPINAKKTMLVQDRPIIKNNFIEGCKEIDKYNYNYKKQIQNSNIVQQQYRQNGLKQSQLYSIQNKSSDYNHDLGLSNLNNSKLFNNNLQFSKINSLHASTITNNNDWFSEPSNFTASQSRLIMNHQQFHQYHWIVFMNENSNMKLNRQLNIQNLKLFCISIESNFFDDFEVILLSDKFKILIIEQKDLVTAEIHMKLGRGDERGAIQALINKIKVFMQQFMLQFNSKQVIVLFQYQNQFFLKMLYEYIFPQLGQLVEKYHITPFYQIEELQEIILDLIQNQENIRYDKLIKVPTDLNKFRSKLQNIEFSNLVTMRCLNQLYQNLVSQLIN